MKVLSSWSVRPGRVKEAVGRFLAGEGAPPEGVKLLGRWHRTDGSSAFAVYETDNPVLLFEAAAKWAEVLDVQHVPVLDDGEIAPVLMRFFGN
ncbi:MAG: DUF3303 family protein [Terracidiphilus sp.]